MNFTLINLGYCEISCLHYPRKIQRQLDIVTICSVSFRSREKTHQLMERLEEQDKLPCIWGGPHQSCACKPLGIIPLKKKITKKQNRKNKQTNKAHKTPQRNKQTKKRKPTENQTHQQPKKKTNPQNKQTNTQTKTNKQKTQHTTPFKFLGGLGHHSCWKRGSTFSIPQNSLSLWQT